MTVRHVNRPSKRPRVRRMPALDRHLSKPKDRR